MTNTELRRWIEEEIERVVDAGALSTPSDSFARGRRWGRIRTLRDVLERLELPTVIDLSRGPTWDPPNPVESYFDQHVRAIERTAREYDPGPNDVGHLTECDGD